MNILVVGAGFAGATVARELAEAGHQVLVIDKRNHIAGNAFDFVNDKGIRVHKYGPHLWHTNNDEVQEWASRFTEWVPYKHYVMADVEDVGYVPLPINHETIRQIFEYEFEDWCADQGFGFIDGDDALQFQQGDLRPAAAAFLRTKQEHHTYVSNSRQHVENSVGKELCDLFFAPYTKKMWGLELEELPVSVAARIPTNVESGSNLYFPNDKHQYVPKDGYTQMVANILKHDNIQVVLSTSREDLFDPKLQIFWQDKTGFNPLGFDHVFTSEPIDVYFGCSLGELPWRSIKMHTHTVPLPGVLPAPVVNFTHEGPFTRVTEWKHIPAHGSNPFWTTLTVEEPCDYRDNSMERYYPVKTANRDCPHRALYNRYVELAEQQSNVTFIGRCGTYQYLDMWMVIAQSLKTVRDFLEASK